MVENLRKLRIERGISQKKLADYINVSQPSINKYENRDIEPDIEVLKKLADYFNTSVDYLIGNTDIRSKTSLKDNGISEREYELLKQFRKLNENEKSCVENMMDVLGSR